MARTEDLPDQQYQLIRALGAVFPYADYNSDKLVKNRWDQVFSELARTLSSGDESLEDYELLHEVSEVSTRRNDTSRRERKILVAIGSIVVASILWSWHDRATLKARQAGHSDIYTTICQNTPGLAHRLLPVDEDGIQYGCEAFENHFDDLP